MPDDLFAEAKALAASQRTTIRALIIEGLRWAMAQPASTMAQALDQVDAWLESPSVVVLTETGGHAEILRAVLESARVVGAQVHDARVFAICLASGMSELWTADRDFNRFSGLTVKNPLVGR
ncbi:MAG: PIN domain-containing protein [Planctomycetota bacterium]